MKLLAFTDVHGSLLALKRIEQKAKTQNPDVMICAGDITIFEHGIISLMKRLDRLNKKILIIHGNHENSSTFIKCSKLFKNIVLIHKNYFIEDNALFLGYGGGGFSIIDKVFEKVVQNKFKKIIKENEDKKIILVTHAPPYKTKLDKLVGGHAGNKSIRNFIEKNKIDLLICGHLHENFGKEDKIGKTKIINPGPFGTIISV
ncbi:MAG: metallophosphoesterase [Nanoarchaeota archaeon]